MTENELPLSRARSKGGCPRESFAHAWHSTAATKRSSESAPFDDTIVELATGLGLPWSCCCTKRSADQPRSRAYYTRGSEGTLFAKRTTKGKPAETEYYVQEAFGSIAMLTSSGGGQTAPASGTYQYDPYGSSIGAAPSTFGFESSQTLPAGLVHFGARYYQPAVGSWTQQDPLNQAEDLTQAGRYLYASDDAINVTDLTGLCSLGPLSLPSFLCGAAKKVLAHAGAACLAYKASKWRLAHWNYVTNTLTKAPSVGTILGWGWDCSPVGFLPNPF